MAHIKKKALKNALFILLAPVLLVVIVFTTLNFVYDVPMADIIERGYIFGDKSKTGYSAWPTVVNVAGGGEKTYIVFFPGIENAIHTATEKYVLLFLVKMILILRQELYTTAILMKEIRVSCIWGKVNLL